MMIRAGLPEAIFVLSEDERRAYHDVGANTASMMPYIERLRRAEGVVFVYPTWWYGMPAVLKGYIDRVWVPGVAFELVDGRTRPLLQHLLRYAVVTTYGSPWWLNKFIVADPNRHAMMRGMRLLASRQARTLWLAIYGMDDASVTKRRRFLESVRGRMARF